MKELTKKNIFDLIEIYNENNNNAIDIDTIYSKLKKKKDLECELRNLNNIELTNLLDIATKVKNSNEESHSVKYSLNKDLFENKWFDYFYNLTSMKDSFFNVIINTDFLYNLNKEKIDELLAYNSQLNELEKFISTNRAKILLDKIKENNLNFEEVLDNPFKFTKLEELKHKAMGEPFNFDKEFVLDASQANALSLVKNNTNLRINYMGIKVLNDILSKEISTYASFMPKSQWKRNNKTKTFERVEGYFAPDLNYFLNNESTKCPNSKININMIYTQLIDILDKDVFKIYQDNTSKDIKIFFKNTFDKELDLEEYFNTLIENTRYVTKEEFTPINIDNKLVSQGKNIELSVEQMQVAKRVAALKSGLAVITGSAGSGKTTVTNKILDLRMKMNINSKNDVMIFAAPMGIAATRLSEALNRPAMTVHRALREEDKLKAAKLILIDEVGFADMHLLDKVLSKVNKTECLVIFLGDKNQLAPVNEGMLLRDLEENFYNNENSKFEHFYNLKTVFRQGKDSNILQFANNVLKGNSFYKQTADLEFQDEIQDKFIINLLKKENYFTEDIKDFHILSIMKEGQGGVKMINNFVQNEFNKIYNRTKFIKNSFTKLYEQDKVIIQKNITIDGMTISNGEIGIIKSINPNDSITIELSFGDFVFDRQLLDLVNLAYCTSVHKVQGGGWKKVLFLMQKQHIYLATRNLLYTGVTRASEKLIICSSPQTLKIATFKQEINTRKTDVGNKIKGGLNNEILF